MWDRIHFMCCISIITFGRKITCHMLRCTWTMVWYGMSPVFFPTNVFMDVSGSHRHSHRNLICWWQPTLVAPVPSGSSVHCKRQVGFQLDNATISLLQHSVLLGALLRLVKRWCMPFLSNSWQWYLQKSHLMGGGWWGGPDLVPSGSKSKLTIFLVAMQMSLIHSV